MQTSKSPSTPTTIVAIALAVFIGIAIDIARRGFLFRTDANILRGLQLAHTPLLTEAMRSITALGSWRIVVPGVIIIAALFVLRRRWHLAAALLCSVGVGEAIVWITKQIARRPRPLVVGVPPIPDFGFPSGHAFIALSCYGLLAYFIFHATKNSATRIATIVIGLIIVLAIGFSRLYLGVHWPSDVLAGYALGVAWLAVVINALRVGVRKK